MHAYAAAAAGQRRCYAAARGASYGASTEGQVDWCSPRALKQAVVVVLEPQSSNCRCLVVWEVRRQRWLSRQLQLVQLVQLQLPAGDVADIKLGVA